MEKQKNVKEQEKLIVSENEVDQLVEELDNMLANFARNQIEKVC